MTTSRILQATYNAPMPAACSCKAGNDCLVIYNFDIVMQSMNLPPRLAWPGCAPTLTNTCMMCRVPQGAPHRTHQQAYWQQAQLDRRGEPGAGPGSGAGSRAGGSCLSQGERSHGAGRHAAAAGQDAAGPGTG